MLRFLFDQLASTVVTSVSDTSLAILFRGAEEVRVRVGWQSEAGIERKL